MPLPSTGTIGHAEIMAEFEKTGKFDLSADGAALIDKTTGQIINESDFYGASNVIEGVEQWPPPEYCSSNNKADLQELPWPNGNALNQTPGDGCTSNVSGYGCPFTCPGDTGAHTKRAQSIYLGFQLVGGAVYEISYDYQYVYGGRGAGGDWWGVLHMGITGGASCMPNQPDYKIPFLQKIHSYSSENSHWFMDKGSVTGYRLDNKKGSKRVTCPSSLNGKDAHLRYSSENNNGFNEAGKYVMRSVSCVRVG
jgi:hypothetical protein